MSEPQRQSRKLVKRNSPSRERAQSQGKRHSQQDAPAVPPLNADAPAVPQDTRKSRWRLSNPFHGKDKERKDNAAVIDDPAPDPAPSSNTPATENPATRRGDSAYFSSEQVGSSRSDVNNSGHQSFSSSERPPQAPAANLQAANANLQPPNTSITPPTPASALGQSQATRANVETNQDNAQQQSYTDQRTGNVVVTTTTVSHPLSSRSNL